MEDSRAWMELLESEMMTTLSSSAVELASTAAWIAVSSAVYIEVPFCIFRTIIPGGLGLTTAKAVPSVDLEPSVYTRESLACVSI